MFLGLSLTEMKFEYLLFFQQRRHEDTFILNISLSISYVNIHPSISSVKLFSKLQFIDIFFFAGSPKATSLLSSSLYPLSQCHVYLPSARRPVLKVIM